MTSISLDKRTERRLDKLRAAVRRRTGRPVSRADLIEHLVNDGYESRDEVVDMFREGETYVADEETGTVHRPERQLVSGGAEQFDE
ncbi:MAG: hypothetical protein ABEH86_01450 [Haloarcula sp.]